MKRRCSYLVLLVTLAAFLSACGEATPRQTASRGEVGSTTMPTAATTTTTVPPSTTTTTNPYVVVRDVTTEEGWRYRITIAAAVSQPDPTPDRCIELAPPGKTNLRWAIVVKNLLTDRPAPWPFITTGLNLNEAGTAVDRQATTVLKALAFRPVNISPNETTMCFLRSTLDGGSRNERMIEPGASEDFAVTAGPVSDPAPAGTVLLANLEASPIVTVPAR